MKDELYFRRAKIVRDMVNSPLFRESMKEILQQIAMEALATKPEERNKREDLYFEQIALARIIGRLQATANDFTHAETMAAPKGAA